MSRILFDAFDSTPETPTIPAPNKFAGMLAQLLPPGRIWRLTWGNVLSAGASVLAAILAACADELGRFDARANVDFLNEADPSTAIELLPDYESELDITPGASDTNAQRQARIVGHLISQQGFKPADFQAALAPILVQAVSDVDVIEISHAQADSANDDRRIYNFFVYRNPTLPGAYDLASAQALINKIKPSHTLGLAIESVDALPDDSHTLCDRDLPGA